ATFGLTVFADLTVAVEVGMVMAALLYIYQVSETTSVAAVTPQYVTDGQAHILQDKVIPAYATILRIHGPVPVRRDQQARGCDPRYLRLRPDRDSAPAQHDCARCHGIPYHRDALRKGASIGTHHVDVRRPQTAGKVDSALEVLPDHRREECAAPHRRGAGAGEGDS